VRPAYFADLDATTLFSARWTAGFTADELHQVEGFDGGHCSFMTTGAIRKLRLLAQAADFVPTTTRSLQQATAVRFAGAEPEYMIIANGIHILFRGEIDADWAERSAAIADLAAPADDVLAACRLAARPHPDVRVKTHSGIVTIVLPRTSPGFTIDHAAGLREIADAADYSFSQQGRSIMMLPRGLTKDRAAGEVARRLGATLTAAAGDSYLDLGMLGWADIAVRPRHGELHGHDVGIRETETSGVAAGEEILDIVAAELGVAL